MSHTASFSFIKFLCLVPAALTVAFVGCGGSGDEDGNGANNGSGSNNGKGGNGGKAGSGGGSGGIGSNGSGGGVNINNNGTDCNRKDGKVDQIGCACPVVGKKQACFAGDPRLAGLGVCNLGTQECQPAEKSKGEVGPDTVWGPCTGSGTPKPEICDNIDQNCNGDVKEGCPCQSGETEGCITGTGFDGQRTCTNGSWGACTPSTTTTPCTDGQTEGCKTTSGEPGKHTCEKGQWGSCTPDTTVVCTPGTSEGCKTADGKPGKQTCQPNGTWGTCTPDDTSSCTPGATEGCAMPSGEAGTKSCKPDGLWGACTPNTTTTCVPGSWEGCKTADGKTGKKSCQPGGTWGACTPGDDTSCTPGASEGCTTENGQDSAHTCKPDGTWGACTPTTTTTPCKPGQVDGCVDPSGAAGSKVCKPDGTWGACTPTTACVPTAEVCDGKDNDCDGKVDGIIDIDGCIGQCPNGGGQRVCLNGVFSKCACEGGGCVEDEICATACGPGVKKCENGQLGNCTSPPVEQACICPDGKPSTQLCQNGQIGACKCGSVPPGGDLECYDCIAKECPYEKIAAASQNTFGTDVSQCKSAYDKFIECVKANPGAVYVDGINGSNGICDWDIGGCDCKTAGCTECCNVGPDGKQNCQNAACGNIIRLAADCVATGQGVGVGQIGKPGGCDLECK